MSTDISTKSTKKSDSDIGKLFDIFFEKLNGLKKDKEKSFIDLIVAAKDEWSDAQSYFNNVSEPELVDYAIHRVDAARVRYMYLLNEAKKLKITVNDMDSVIF